MTPAAIFLTIEGLLFQLVNAPCDIQTIVQANPGIEAMRGSVSAQGGQGGQRSVKLCWIVREGNLIFIDEDGDSGHFPLSRAKVSHGV